MSIEKDPASGDIDSEVVNTTDPAEKSRHIDPSILLTPDQKREAIEQVQEKINLIKQKIAELCDVFDLGSEFMEGRLDRKLAVLMQRFLSENLIEDELSIYKKNILPEVILYILDEKGHMSPSRSLRLTNTHCVHVMMESIKNVEKFGEMRYEFHPNFFLDSLETLRFWTTSKESPALIGVLTCAERLYR